MAISSSKLKRLLTMVLVGLLVAAGLSQWLFGVNWGPMRMTTLGLTLIPILGVLAYLALPKRA